MNELIQEKLSGIEATYGVKILYAVESGSRAWGFPSKDSDYDVRFIYIHPPDWYLSIDPQGVGPKRDVIEEPINELLDISGWELTKTLRLYRKSNPALLEWLRSEIIYHEAYSFSEQMAALEPAVFQPLASLRHYLNMAKANYRGYLQGPEVKIKKYFYALRPIFACRWIERHGTVPPIRFSELMDAVLPEGRLKQEIELLLNRKMAGDELDIEPRVDAINDFLDEEFVRLELYVQTLHMKNGDVTGRLDTFFKHMLNDVWADKESLFGKDE